MPVHSLADLGREQRLNSSRGADSSGGEAGVGEARPAGVYPLLAVGGAGDDGDGRPPRFPLLRDFFAPRFAWRTATAAITAAQLALFAATLAVAAARAPHQVFDPDNATGGPSGSVLEYVGGKQRSRIRAGQVYRLVLPVFLHAGILHIMGNLFIQSRVAFSLERRWTAPRFVALYLVSGVAGNLVSCAAEPGGLSVGASGAIMGVLGADLAYCAYNYTAVPLLRQEAVLVAVLAVLNLLVGLATPHTDNWSHLGGLVAGALCGVCLVTHLAVRPWAKALQIGTAAALAVGLAALSAALFA